MSEDNSMKSVLGAFDSLAQTEGPPKLKFLAQPPSPPVRTPKDSFMEWSLRGGGALTLVLTAVVLAAARWSFTSLDLLIIPLVVLLARPFLGAYPLANGFRVAGVSALAGILGVLGVSALNFGVASMEKNRYDILNLAESLQQSVSHATDPLPFLLTCLLGWLGLEGSRRLATHNPWLDRPRRGSKALVVAAILLGILAVIPLASVHAGWPRSDRAWLEQARNSPLIEVYRRTEKMSHHGHAFDLEALARMGLSEDWSANEQTLKLASEDDLTVMATELAASLRKNRESLTEGDLSICRQLLYRLEEKKIKLSNREVVDFWNELAETAHYWKLGWGLSPSRLNGESASRLVIPALERGELSAPEMEALREQVAGRTLRSDEEAQLARDLAFVTELEGLYQDSYYGYRFEPTAPPLRLFGVPVEGVSFVDLLTRAETSYLLNHYEYGRHYEGESKEPHPRPAEKIPHLFSGPLTQERLRMMFSRVASRTELLPYEQPGRVLKCLDRLLAEAGRSK